MSRRDRVLFRMAHSVAPYNDLDAGGSLYDRYRQQVLFMSARACDAKLEGAARPLRMSR